MTEVLHALIEVLQAYKAKGIPYELEIKDDFAVGKLGFFERWRFDFMLNDYGFEYFEQMARLKYQEHLRMEQEDKVMAG